MVRTRKELIEYYTAILSGYYSEFIEEERTRNPWLKTQLLELDAAENQESSVQIESLLRQFAEYSQDLTFEALDEDYFYCIKNNNEELESIYVDALDNRFITLYSSMHREPFDDAVDALTKNTNVDRAWFPQDFMNTLEGLGLFRGYGGKFNNEFFVEEPNSSLDDNPKFRNLSFKSWGNTKRLLDLIQSDGELKDEFALTNMRVKVAYDLHDEHDTVIDDITFAGRITSLGHSFRAHNEAVLKVRDAYKHLVVDVIEGKYGFHYTDNSLQGGKLTFELSRELYDLEDFSKRLFSGKKPFRLWGLETVSKNNFVRVEVLDLHVKSRFLVEVFPEKITVLIKKGVCGNTVLRLLTLLQQTLSSGVRLVNDDNELIELGMSADG